MSIKLNLNSPQTIASQNLQAVASEALALEAVGSSFSFANTSFALLNSVSKSVAVPKLLDGGVSVVVILFLLGLAGCDSATSEAALTDADVVPDQDGDGKPDGEDECPEVFGNTFNGCPLPRNGDSDGDGISDDKDECPNDPHPSLDPEANGCAPFVSDSERDGGLPAPMPDPSAPKPWTLLFQGQGFLQRENIPTCPQLSSSHDHTFLSWEEGLSLYLSEVSPRHLEVGIGEIEDVGITSASIVTTCNLTHSIATNENGQTAILFPHLRNDNETHLSLRVREADGTLSDPKQVAILPFATLDTERRNTIASIKSLPNNNFALVWTDRDRVNLSIITPEGEIGPERVLVNRRAAPDDTLHVKNPDLSVVDGNTLEVVWQEGSTAFGNIMRARFTFDGEEVSAPENISYIDEVQSNGRFPVIVSTPVVQIAAWQSEAGKGVAHFLPEEGVKTLFTFSENGSNIFSPSLTLDDQHRLGMVWLEEDGRDAAKAYLASVGSVESGVSESEYRGTVLASVPADARIAISQQGDDVVVVLPNMQPANSIMLRRFQWKQVQGRGNEEGQ